MPELNLLTAFAFGAFAAAVWAIVAIRRLLRSGAFPQFTQRQRLVVWCVSVLAFLPSLLLGFLASMALTNVTLHPGPWLSLVFALTFALGIGLFGAASTWAAALLAAVIVRSASRSGQRAA